MFVLLSLLSTVNQTSRFVQKYNGAPVKTFENRADNENRAMTASMMLYVCPPGFDLYYNSISSLAETRGRTAEFFLRNWFPVAFLTDRGSIANRAEFDLTNTA